MKVDKEDKYAWKDKYKVSLEEERMCTKLVVTKSTMCGFVIEDAPKIREHQ